MIRSVEVKGLRGIREGKLDDLTSLVVLVGPNSCGKSSVIDALLIGASPAPARAIGRVVSRHTGVSEGSRWFFWKGDTSHDVHIILSNHKGETTTSSLTIGIENPSGHPMIWCTVHKRAADTFSDNSRVGVSFNDIQPANYTMNVPYFESDNQAYLVEAQSSILQTPFVELYSRAVEQGRRQAALTLLADVVPTLINLEILIEKGVPLLYVVFDTYSLPVALLGDGVQSLLRLSLELASRPGGLVLIEEPEVHQHPGGHPAKRKGYLGCREAKHPSSHFHPQPGTY